MTKKIYVIEDNEKNLSLFIAILNTITGIELVTDNRGDTGLKLIKEGNPDLIILDIQLPGMSGIEICKELRKIDRFNKTPILAVTAFSMKGDMESIMAAGFTQYIAKPIRVIPFKEVITRYL